MQLAIEPATLDLLPGAWPGRSGFGGLRLLRREVMIWVCAAFFAFVISNRSAQAASARGGEAWLVLNDIYLDPFDRSLKPSYYSSDSNLALFESAVRKMKHAAPNPAVVLLGGDFLEHNFARHVRESGSRRLPMRPGFVRCGGSRRSSEPRSRTRGSSLS